MDYQFEMVGDVLKVSLDGRLVAACSEDFKETMFERLKDHKSILFDLTKMAHIDSSGLGALVSILQRVNSSGGVIKLHRILYLDRRGGGSVRRGGTERIRARQHKRGMARHAAVNNNCFSNPIWTHYTIFRRCVLNRPQAQQPLIFNPHANSS